MRRNAKGIEVPVDDAVVDSFNCAANTRQLRFDGDKGFRVDQPGSHFQAFGGIPPSHGRFATVRNPSFLSINLIEALPSDVRQPRREDGDYPFVHYYFPNDFSTFHRDLNEEPWKRPYDEFDRIIQV